MNHAGHIKTVQNINNNGTDFVQPVSITLDPKKEIKSEAHAAAAASAAAGTLEYGLMAEAGQAD